MLREKEKPLPNHEVGEPDKLVKLFFLSLRFNVTKRIFKCILKFLGFIRISNKGIG